MITTLFRKEPNYVLHYFVVVALLMILSIADIKYHLHDSLEPISENMLKCSHMIISWSNSAWNNVACYFHSIDSLIIENAHLKKRILIYQGKLQLMSALKNDNANLYQLLNSLPLSDHQFLVANLLNINPDPFSQQVLINKGRKQDICEGDMIINAYGVIGSVYQVMDQMSRILLLTDTNHAIPVISTRNDIRAIAIGNGKMEFLLLQHLSHTIDVQEGDIFVTSGLGDKFVPGFPVGIVQSVTHNNDLPFAYVHLKPIASFKKSTHILVVRNKKFQ